VAAESPPLTATFRLAKGAINYDDQIALAGALLRHPEPRAAFAKKNYR